MSFLTKAIALFTFTLLTSIDCLALGIGNIAMHSALNQSLNADILLVMLKDENLEDIKANIVNQSKIYPIDLPWTPLMSKISFSTKTLPDGSIYINLSTKETVKEPFLHFMLQVSNSKTSLYREFTVLLDPPAEYFKM